jgi:hypothetical protein
MPGCRIVEERKPDRTVLRVSGVFDSASACELRDRLAHQRADRVTLDFSLVREFGDHGVATLANGLAGGAWRLTLRGLRQHQRRIFRYFGVDVT